MHNVEANHDVTIEVGNRVGRGDRGRRGDPAERDRLWDQHVAALPNFADYPAQTGRVIPMIRITPATTG